MVSKRTSAINRTVHHNYEGDKVTNTPSQGAKWESVEFMNIEEEKPPITVANVQGSVFLTDGAKLMINDPELFGTFEAGDIVELRVIRSGTPVNPQVGSGG